MMPKRGGKWLFTYITTATRKLDSFVCVKHLVESCNMAFVSFAEPTWPGLKEQNLLSFYIYITQGMIRVV
jgi:hypothetical protein